MARPIKIEILGDDKSIRKAFGRVDKGVGGLLKPLAGMGAAIAGVFAVNRLKGFGGELFNLARDITDVTRKVNTVFGDQADEVNRWADSLNESFGVTANQVALMGANVADLLKPMGFTTRAATDMSKEIVELAPALAEWSGGMLNASQVSGILSKAMLGEREGLKALGISINQAEVDMRALQVAQKDGRTEFNEMDKAIATQQLIFEKSADAQAGYVTGTETLAGQQNLLKARFAELKESLAKGLTPAFLAVGNWMVGTFVPVIQNRVIPALQRFRDPLRDLANRWLPRIRAGVQAATEWLRDELAPAATHLARRLLPPLKRVFDDTITVLRAGVGWLNDNREAVTGFGVILVAMFTAWAVSATAAAVATLAAAAPIIALGVAIGALAVLVRRAYNEHEGFRNAIDGVARFARDRLWPALQDVGGWIRDTLIPVVAAVAVKIGEWTIKFVDAAIKAGSYIDDIVRAVVGAATSIGGAAADIYNAITKPFRDAFGWITDAWNALQRFLGNEVRGGAERTFAGGGGAGGTFTGGGGAGRTLTGPGGARAMGGHVTRTGLYNVGERGREQVMLPQGARVIPAHATTGSGGDTINIYGSNLTATDVARELAWRRRIGSGR